MEFRINRSSFIGEVETNFLSVLQFKKIISFIELSERSKMIKNKNLIGFWHIKPKNREHEFLYENLSNE